METIEKKREPLPAMEAIYLITPTESSVRELKNDFASQHRTMYRAAHVYFTEGNILYFLSFFIFLIDQKHRGVSNLNWKRSTTTF